MLYLDDPRSKYYIDWINLHHESFSDGNASRASISDSIFVIFSSFAWKFLEAKWLKLESLV